MAYYNVINIYLFISNIDIIEITKNEQATNEEKQQQQEKLETKLVAKQW